MRETWVPPTVAYGGTSTRMKNPKMSGCMWGCVQMPTDAKGVLSSSPQSWSYRQL